MDGVEVSRYSEKILLCEGAKRSPSLISGKMEDPSRYGEGKPIIIEA